MSSSRIVLSKGQKGVVRRFLVKVTGLSRAQMTRLVGRWMKQRCAPAHPGQPYSGMALRRDGRVQLDRADIDAWVEMGKCRQ